VNYSDFLNSSFKVAPVGGPNHSFGLLGVVPQTSVHTPVLATACGNMDTLFDEWCNQYSLFEDWSAIRASLNDMETGEAGRTFESFELEFKQRYNIRECA
jgi:hypothetical protein